MYAMHHDVATITVIGWIILLVVGGLAGWIAGLIVRGSGFGLIGNIAVGIVGAVIAGWLLPRIGLFVSGGILAWFVDALIGAIILLAVVGLLRRLWARPGRSQR